MNIESHAKAVAAFVAVLGAALVAFAACAVLGLGAPSALTAAPFLASVAATVVWWVPNRTHGYNVADIAAVLIKAGLEATESKGDRR